MPVEENPDDANSPKKSQGENTSNDQEISPNESIQSIPGRRVTRRTFQLEETIVDSPIPTRRSTRTRKITTDDTVDTPTRRTTRGSNIPETETIQVPVVAGTPKRITRRSASIQSDDGNSALPQAIQKLPSEATIKEEELPISRRTRASSVTSDDGSVVNVGTPKKRGRKSLAANVKPIEPVIEEQEENQSPARPITRSMSQSPANVSVEKTSPLKQKSPLVGSNGTEQLEYSLKSPGTHKTPDKKATTPQSAKKTPVNSNSMETRETPKSSGKNRAETPKSQSKTPQSAKKSDATPKKSEFSVSTPYPHESKVNGKEVFSKSWSQPVIGSAAKTPKIDEFGTKKKNTPRRVSTSAINIQTRTLIVSSSDDSDEPDNDFEEFVDDKAVVSKNYESGDSMDVEERELAEENRMHEELGEDIGSEDTGSEESDDYSKDSFIVSEGEHDLLSYSDDDEHLDSPSNKKSPRKSAPARVMVLSSDEESSREPDIPTEKPQSLPKIKLQQRLSTGDPDISCKPIETTLFNVSATSPKKLNVSSKPQEQSIQEEEEEDEETAMQVDQSPISPKKQLLNRSIKESIEKDKETPKKDQEGSEIKLVEASPAKLAAAKSSLLNSSKRLRGELSSQKSSSPSVKAINGNGIQVDEHVPETDESSSDSEIEDELKNTSDEASSDSDSDDEMEVETEVVESESAKRKRKRRTAGLDESNSDQQPIKKTKLNVSLVSNEKLDTILEKCNEILKTKKEEKKKNKLLHKKEKEEKKKRKELLKKQAEEEEEGSDKEESKDETLKKKKKKQKIGRKYNQDIAEPTSTKQEEINQALKRSEEILLKKRERKRLKKLAKLEKAKENGGVVDSKKTKNDKENVNSSNKNKKEASKEPEMPKKKTLLTAYEVKQQLLQDTNAQNVQQDKGKKEKKVVIPDKENTDQTQVSKKQKKKKAKILEPVNESNNSEPSMSPPSPPPKKRLLSILNAKGSLNKQGFIVDPVTPDHDRLKRNKGFIEEPQTPKPIGFKVQSMMPNGEEFVKKANKKRKRVEIDIPEPSRLPPKPIWTASGAFEEVDAPEISDYIPLSSKSNNPATQFGVAVLGKKSGKVKNVAAQGLSNFKMKALYKDKSRFRETGKDLARKLEKQKYLKRTNA